MANAFTVTKAAQSKLRKLPFLPRFGIVVDFGGLQLSYKHAPILETLLNARQRGLNLKNFVAVANETMKEITLAVGPARERDGEKKAPVTVAAKKKKSKPTTQAV